MPRGVINNYPRTFAFRLTEADGERLDAVAAAAGTTPGEWARQEISRALDIACMRRAMRSRIANADELRRLLAQQAAQGNNLNQIARRLNSELSADATAVRADIAAIRAAQAGFVTAIVAALGGTAQP